MSFCQLTIVVLTYNENLHLDRCVESCKKLTDKIIVVDSDSNDNTKQIAISASVQCVNNPWPGNQARQFNWALNNLEIDTEWVLRLDADEYLTDELIAEIKSKLHLLDPKFTGVILKRRHVFLNKWVKRGVYPVKLLRLFKHKYASYNDTWMDEHIVLSEGRTIEFDHDFVDHNLNDLSWWSKKHIEYATREAIELLDIEYDLKSKTKCDSRNTKAVENKSKRNRYYTSPLLLRALFYFCYRYFWKLGFLDGKIGFIWNFLQGFWYRVLVDSKVIEIKQKCDNDREKIIQYLKTEYNYDI